MVSDAPYPPWLSDWCRDHLGAVPVTTLLHVDQMSEVFGLRLDNGHKVVVKARPDPSRRATTCVRAQRYLAARDFPCAAPLTDATHMGELAVHAEHWRPGGQLLRGDTPEIAARFARLLATLIQQLAGIALAPPLPNPRWVDWDHPGDSIWPAAAFLDEQDQTLVPTSVSDTARRATARLVATDLPRVLGHADWETQNIRWHGTHPWTVHDWDSLAWLPEAALVGAASGTFASAEIPTLAPLASSHAFLHAYQDARRRSFTPEEVEIAWAASLWPAAHNARGQSLFARPPVALRALEAQAEQRLTLAGA